MLGAGEIIFIKAGIIPTPPGEYEGGGRQKLSMQRFTTVGKLQSIHSSGSQTFTKVVVTILNMGMKQKL